MTPTKGKERNFICENCGNKNKNCTCKSNWEKFFSYKEYIITLLLFTLIGITIFTITRNLHQKKQEQKKIEFTKTISLYLQNRPTDQWWLQTRPEKSEEKISLCFQKAREIDNLFSRNKDLNSLSKEIFSATKNKTVSVFINGISLMFFDKNSSITPENMDIEICFTPQDQLIHQRNPLWYNPNWNALMIHALDFPKALFSGILYHEAGHAKYFKDKNPSSTASPSSDLYAEEEIIMHELEADIINQETKGEFFRYIDNHVKNFKNYKEAILSLKAKNLQDLDKITGCEKSGTLVASIASAQYIVSVGLRCINKNNIKEKVELYKFVRSI